MVHKPSEPAPILLITYKRAEYIDIILNILISSGVKKIYVASNAPKNDSEYEVDAVLNCREKIKSYEDKIDIEKRFLKEHLQVNESIISAIDWFFSNVERGIILEDDIIPSRDFLFFSTAMLEKYEYNSRVMHIAGMTYVEAPNQISSYHFVDAGGIWGWATWQDKWKNIHNYRKIIEAELARKILEFKFKNASRCLYKHYLTLLKECESNNNPSWDYRWIIVRLTLDSINIMPCKNLVRNVGFADAMAENTKYKNNFFQSLEVSGLNWPLIEPSEVCIDHDFSIKNLKMVFDCTFLGVFKRKVKEIIKRTLLQR